MATSTGAVPTITNRTRYVIPAGYLIRPPVYGDWIYIIPAAGVVQNLDGAAITIGLNNQAGTAVSLGDLVSTLNDIGGRVSAVAIANAGPNPLTLDITSGTGDYTPAPYDNSQVIAHADAAGLLAELVQIDTDVVAAKTQAHSDANGLNSSLGTIDTDILAAKAQAHSDAVGINGNIMLLATQVTAAQIDADILAAKAQAHSDAVAINANVGLLATEVTAAQIDTDILAAKAQAHSDALGINANIGLLATEVTAAQIDTDVVAGTAAIVAAIAAGDPTDHATVVGASAVNGVAGAGTVAVGTVAAPATLLICANVRVNSGGAAPGAAKLKIVKVTSGTVLYPLMAQAPALAQSNVQHLARNLQLEVGDRIFLEQDAAAGTSSCDIVLSAP